MRSVYVLATFDNWRVSYHVATMDKDLAESLERIEELLEQTRKGIGHLNQRNEDIRQTVYVGITSVILVMFACAYPIVTYALVRLEQMGRLPWPWVNKP